MPVLQGERWFGQLPLAQRVSTSTKQPVSTPSKSSTGTTTTWSQAISDQRSVPPVGNFPTVHAYIGNSRIIATVDSASTVNLMALSEAKLHRLTIDRSQAKTLNMVKGKTQTIGTVKVRLMIHDVSHIITVSVLRNFAYVLLLGAPTCRLFGLRVDFDTLTVSIPRITHMSTHVANTVLASNSAMAITSDSDTHVVSDTHVDEVQDTQAHHGQPSTSQSQLRSSTLADILQEYETLFSKSPTDVGKITVESHRILLKDDNPVAQKPYRQSLRDVQETLEQVQQLLKSGLIKESVSPYAAPVTLDNKSDVGNWLKRCLC